MLASPACSLALLLALPFSGHGAQIKSSFTKNDTDYGFPVEFYEVPDFYPLSTPTRHHQVAHEKAASATTRHVLAVDPWGVSSGGHHVHNVEWHLGDWSADGSEFNATSTGFFDYGWWYAARSLSDSTNTGRRLMLGNIGTDVTQGPEPNDGHLGMDIRFFTAHYDSPL